MDLKAAGKTTIAELAALLAQCDLIVSLDTGTFHVARAAIVVELDAEISRLQQVRRLLVDTPIAVSTSNGRPEWFASVGNVER